MSEEFRTRVSSVEGFFYLTKHNIVFNKNKFKLLSNIMP